MALIFARTICAETPEAALGHQQFIIWWKQQHVGVAPALEWNDSCCLRVSEFDLHIAQQRNTDIDVTRLEWNAIASCICMRTKKNVPKQRRRILALVHSVLFCSFPFCYVLFANPLHRIGTVYQWNWIAIGIRRRISQPTKLFTPNDEREKWQKSIYSIHCVVADKRHFLPHSMLCAAVQSFIFNCKPVLSTNSHMPHNDTNERKKQNSSR